jgi:chaperonin GroES
MKLKPLADRVIVKSMEAEEKTASGLIIPDTAKEKPQMGEVIEVGPGRFEKGEYVKMQVKKGDKVLYGKYSGTEVDVDGVKYLIMHETDIFAVQG